MDFDFSDEQRLLKESVDRLAAQQYGFEQRDKYLASEQGWSNDVWQQCAEVGLLAMPFREEDGGFGGGTVETMVVMETIGRHLMLEPYLATVVLGGGFLRLGSSDRQRQALIPLIADGSLKLAFAQAEAQSRYCLHDISTRAERDGDGWVLHGSKRFVIHGDCADKLIVTARVNGGQRERDGVALFLINADQPGVERRNYLTQDRLRAADITLGNVRVGDDAVIGEPGKAIELLEQVVDGAIAALCAEAVGVMAQALDLTVDYLRTRKQFGVTIGSFQALQHRAVDMLVMVEQARSMAYLATMTAGEADANERRRTIAAAKIQVGKSAKFVGQQAIQLHGGIGMTQECQVGHYFRRLSMIELAFGDTDHHLKILAESGGLLEASAA